MERKILLALLLLFTTSCSNTRWTIVDTEAIDSRDTPRVLDSVFEIVEEQPPTFQDPYFSISVRQINEVEVPQRVLAERTVQRYRPRPVFTVLSGLGAAFSFYAANSDLTGSSLSSTQAIALNATGLFLATLSITHLKPVGEPIHTGEQKFLRQSGEILRKDTVAVADDRNFSVGVTVSYRGSSVYSLESAVEGSSSLSLNLVNILQNRDITGPDPGELTVDVDFQGVEHQYSYPVSAFLTPVIRIQSPVAQIRSEPVITNGSLFNEVGPGSEMSYLATIGNQWYEVQSGGSTVYVSWEDGEIHWVPSRSGEVPTVYTVSNVPFGDLAVENSVPVVRDAGSSDVGVILSNHQNNQVGQRNYIDRDLRLIDLYFRNALDLPADRIHRADYSDSISLENDLNRIETDSSSVLYVYLEGFGQVTRDSLGRATVELLHVDQEGVRSTVPLDGLFERFTRLEGDQLILFVDIDFQPDLSRGEPGLRQLAGSEVLLRAANQLLAGKPNSVVIFSSRADQTSGVYASERFENMHHHIFPYYIARAFQQRITDMNDFVRYLENQVDYTSRLLYDRPQEIQSFGNLTIELSE